jgi:hypothetical protein
MDLKVTPSHGKSSIFDLSLLFTFPGWSKLDEASEYKRGFSTGISWIKTSSGTLALGKSESTFLKL